MEDSAGTAAVVEWEAVVAGRRIVAVAGEIAAEEQIAVAAVAVVAVVGMEIASVQEAVAFAG